MRPFLLTAFRMLGALLLMAASSCLASHPPRPAPTPVPSFDPIVFFAGRTQGVGTLTARFSATRSIRVESTGKTEQDGSFRLDQTVTLGNGSVHTRFWRIRRVDSTHYSATLSDATGDVTADTDGNRFHLRYLLRRPAVYVEQWLYLEPDGRSATNIAQVTVLGIPWARLTETITRVDDSR